MILSQRFDQALQYAVIIHAADDRKGTGVPYIAHLLGVTSIALEYGADEDEAIAALLHDAAEDAGGAGRLADIEIRFGKRVAEIVEGCTDTTESPKPPWHERKRAYVAHLPGASASTRLVSASDKLYNSRAIVRDLRANGQKAWEKFNAPKADVLWYYRALLEAFREAGGGELVEEFGRVVAEMDALKDA